MTQTTIDVSSHIRFILDSKAALHIASNHFCYELTIPIENCQFVRDRLLK